MNGTRLSLFAPVQAALGVDAESNGKMAFFFRNLAAGAACGACGALIGSPLFLIKARLQSQSTAHSLRTAGGGEFRWVGVFEFQEDRSSYCISSVVVWCHCHCFRPRLVRGRL